MMKVPSTVTRDCLVNRGYPAGIFGPVFSAAATLAKTGVSCSETRTYRPMITSTAEKINGTRQAPLHKLLVGQQPGEQQEGAVGEEEADRRAQLWEGAVQGALARLGRFP